MLALAAWAASKLCKKRVMAAVLAVCLGVSAAGIIAQHPYQYAYYQPAAQLRGTDFNELDYWNISARDAMEQLASQVEGDIAIAPADLWSEHAILKALAAMDEATAARFTMNGEAMYVLSNPTYAAIGGFEPDGLEAVVTLSSYGQPIMVIYQKGA